VGKPAPKKALPLGERLLHARALSSPLLSVEPASQSAEEETFHPHSPAGGLVGASITTGGSGGLSAETTRPTAESRRRSSEFTSLALLRKRAKRERDEEVTFSPDISASILAVGQPHQV